jgi:dipeptidyl aminopeptidase/acylaminoacyl peptidase
MKKISFIWMTMVILVGCSSDEKAALAPYAAQEPLTEPRIFQEGLLSTNQEQNVSFTPDGKFVIYEKANNSEGIMYISEYKDGKWIEPSIPSFAQEGESEGNAYISPDGQRLFFTSTRKVDGRSQGGYDLWYVDKVDNGWGEPQNVGSPINTSGEEVYPAVAANGNMYYNSLNPSNGVLAIFKSEYKDGAYTKPELLSEEINGDTHVLTPFIAPDESYIIFCKTTIDDEADLYISYQDEGRWSVAEKLSDKINSTSNKEVGPYVSPNGEYFFFSRIDGAGGNGGHLYQIDIGEAGIRSR